MILATVVAIAAGGCFAFVYWDANLIRRWSLEQIIYERRIDERFDRLTEDIAWDNRVDTLRALMELEVRRYTAKLDSLDEKVKELSERRSQFCDLYLIPGLLDETPPVSLHRAGGVSSSSPAPPPPSGLLH